MNGQEAQSTPTPPPGLHSTGQQDLGAGGCERRPGQRGTRRGAAGALPEPRPRTHPPQPRGEPSAAGLEVPPLRRRMAQGGELGRGERASRCNYSRSGFYEKERGS